MKIALADIKPNPFRDFDLYPLDDQQVQRLSQSIGDLGFFAGVTARKNGVGYELAAGHHRIAAARRAGLKEVEATVGKYDDQQMVQIMSMENLTQRGHNAASVLDSVAAYARLVTKEVLLGEGNSAKILALSGDRFLSKARTEIAQDGPGRALLYRAINRFAKKDRRENKDAETITDTEISQSLSALKASGAMARIVGEAYAQVETIRAEQDAKAVAETVRAATAAEARAKAEKDAAEVERRRNEREAIEAQKAIEAVYDMQCGTIFRLSSHEAAFREAVLSDNGKRFIPRDRQLDLAKHVRSQIDDIEDKRRHDLGSVTIKRMVGDQITEALKAQTEIEEAERRALLEAGAIARVKTKWKQLATTINRVEQLLEQIATEESDWDYDRDLFPLDLGLVKRLDLTATLIRRIKTKLTKPANRRESVDAKILVQS